MNVPGNVDGSVGVGFEIWSRCARIVRLVCLGVGLLVSALNHGPARAQQLETADRTHERPDSAAAPAPKPQDDGNQPAMASMDRLTGVLRGDQTAGGLGIRWRDRSRDHNLMLLLTFGVPWKGFFDDFGVQTAYLNQQYRLDYGISTGLKTRRFIETSVDTAVHPITDEPTRVVDRFLNRVYIVPLEGTALYPIDDFNWLELQVGVARYGFELNQERVFRDPTGENYRGEIEPTREEQDPYYLGRVSAAAAGNDVSFGFASPVSGSQYRLQVAPRLGERSYLTVLADYRRYVFFEPITLALRGFHIGNYGADPANDAAVEYLGYTYYPGFVRGYSVRSFETDECIDDGACSYIDHLQGTRLAMGSIELRVPVVGPEPLGLIDFRHLPLELSMFLDGGAAWTGRQAPVAAWNDLGERRIPVVSSGAGARVTIFGKAVVELYYTYPFQRPDEGWEFGFRISPGW